jgi:hypothetical protein
MNGLSGWFLVGVTMAAVAVGLVLGALPAWLLGWWETRRTLRAWDRRWTEHERRHALRQQLWDMEATIREEPLSEEERARLQYYREREAEVHREARRRLGLPEEEDSP